MHFFDDSYTSASSSNTSHSSGTPLECNFCAVDLKPELGAFGKFVVAPDTVNSPRWVIYKYGNQTNNPCGVGSSLQSH